MSLDNLRSLCSLMKSKQDIKADLESKLKDINAELDDLRMKQIPSLMESLEVKNATFEGLGRVQLAADLHAGTREGKKEAAYQWLRDCGYESMITETVNASSLKALFRRQIAEGIDIPDEIFNVQPFVRASIVSK